MCIYIPIFIGTLCHHMCCAMLSFSVMSDSLWPHWDFLGKNTRAGCHAFLQGIFPSQGSNPGLLHFRRILYHRCYQGNPRILEWVAYFFSRGSSSPRNQTRVSCITSRFFTSWATREAHVTMSPYISILI